MRHIAALLSVAALAGCAGMQTLDQERQTVSSGLIGCAPAEITVGESAQYTWAATCKARIFQCTVAPSAACTERIR